MIKSLYLRNFKCFENQSIEFHNLTLLSGLNGMGKSSVLQALLLLRQSYQRQLLQNTGLALNGDLVEIGTAEDALYKGAEKQEIAFILTLENGAEGKWHFEYDREKDVLGHASMPVVPPHIFQYSLFTDSFHYLQAERIGPRVIFKKSDFWVKEHKQIGHRGEYTAHFLELLGGNDICSPQLAFPGVESQTLNLQIEAWLNQISPGIRLHLTDNLRMDLINLQYSFPKQARTAQYRATNVGFGITYVLPVIVALLSSSPGALVLLENPEAHLHPQGQAKMGELIARAASCGIQVVVETHSDHLLNGILIAVHAGLLEPEKVGLHFFQQSHKPDDMGSEIISPKVNRDGRLDQWPDGFFDEWDKSLEILLGPSAA
jgi:predicted ATPase